MKKTIWLPVIFGLALGLLAGIAMAVGLSISLPDSAGGINIVGFHMALFLLSAAIGGPLAGAITPITSLITAILFGPPDLRAFLVDPLSFWTNSFLMGAFMALIGFCYRAIFERMKIPVRLLPWIGIILAHYAFHPPILEFLQTGKVNFIRSMVGALDFYTLQILFDVFFTSLVFIALPASFAHPLWYASKKALDQHNRVQAGEKKALNES